MSNDVQYQVVSIKTDKRTANDLREHIVDSGVREQAIQVKKVEADD